MVISAQDALRLPLHDALMLGLNITPTRDGFVTATLNVKINREELVHPLRELGITSSDLNLVFGDCWQVKTNLLGYATAPEVISTFEVEEESALVKNLRGSGVGSQSMTHFKIEGSYGSQLNFVAETFSVVERS
jgi:hypothetical protein